MVDIKDSIISFGGGPVKLYSDQTQLLRLKHLGFLRSPTDSNSATWHL
jgi:hypothetical protein